MKRALLLMMILMLSFTLMAETTWEVCQQAQEPLIYSRDKVFFLNDQEGWLIGTVSGESIIFHTADGGATWEIQFRDDVSGYSFGDVFFATDQIGWVVGNYGLILKTENGGTDWAVQQDSSSDAKHLQAIYASNENFAIAVGNDSTIIRTMNGGSDWEVIITEINTASKTNFGDVYVFDDNRAVVMSNSNDGYIYYTEDGGTTWTQVLAPFPPGISLRQYVCEGIPEGTAFIGAYSGDVFKTTNFGKDWEYVTRLFPSSIYTQLYAADMLDAENIWMGGSDGMIFYSADGGASWDTVASISVNNVKYILATDANNYMVFNTYGHLSRTSDKGATFTPVHSWPNISLWNLVAVNEDKLLAASITGGEITMSEDCGDTWTYPSRLAAGSVNDLYDFDFVNDNLGFYAGRNGQIGKTIDGGLTWELKPNSQHYPGNTVSFQTIAFMDELVGMAAGTKDNVQRTVDGGETWEELNTGLTGYSINDAYIKADGTIIICGSKGAIQVSTDTCTTWTQVSSFGTNILRSIAFVNDNLGYVVGAKGNIYKTEDGGQTWVEHLVLQNQNSTGGTTDHDLYVIEFINDTEGYICGNKGGIYYTEDAGANWTQMDVPEEVKGWTLQAMAWPREDCGFVAGQDGYILVFDDRVTGIDDKPVVSKNFYLDQNYPNPFNPETHIGFNLPRNANVKLVVYNTLGQKVRTLVNGMLPAGYQNITWDGRNDFGMVSPSGIYFYKLEADNFSQIRKMVLMK